MENLLWLFPVIFMLHEMEEIIGFGPWLDKNQAILDKYPRIDAAYEHFSPSGFAMAVLEEYLLVIIITGASLYFANYLVWLGAFIYSLQPASPHPPDPKHPDQKIYSCPS